MNTSVKASEIGIQLADQARKNAGYKNKYKIGLDEEGIYGEGLSEPTLKRFWKREEKIVLQAFQSICQKINIDWRIIVDWENDPSQWQMTTLKYQLTPSHTDGVGTLAIKIIENQVILASGSYDGTIHIWQINNDNFEHLQTLTEHQKDVSSLIFTDACLISGSYDQTIKIWNITSWKCIDTLENEKPIECLALTADDRYLFVSSCESSDIWLWDFQQKKCLNQLQEHKGGQLHHPNPNQPLLMAHGVLGLVPNYNTVISAGMDSQLIAWQISNQEDQVTAIPTLINAENLLKLKAITSLAISPDGKYLAVGENSLQITIWDITNKSLIYNTQGKHDFPNILALAYHPTEKMLASACFDRQTPIIRLWNPENGDIIKTLIHSDFDPIRSLVFSPDGKMLIAGDEKGHIFLWGV